MAPPAEETSEPRGCCVSSGAPAAGHSGASRGMSLLTGVCCPSPGEGLLSVGTNRRAACNGAGRLCRSPLGRGGASSLNDRRLHRRSRAGHDGPLLCALVSSVFAVQGHAELGSKEKRKKRMSGALCKASPAREAALETGMRELCYGTCITSEKHHSGH